MKDLYTFDTSKENAMKTYNLVQRAYKNIFNRIGVAYKICEADTGSIGGTLSNEFHYLSKAGEDKILSCLNCGYSANQEAAKGLVPASTGAEELVNDSPNANLTKSINQFNAKLNNEVSMTYIKLKEEPSKVYAIVSKSDREINWLPIEKFIQHPYELISSDQSASIKQENIHYLVDNYFKSGEVNSEQSTIGNTSYIHLHLTQSGDHCPRCASHNKQNIALEEFKAIEVGHTFYLGTKYSALLNSTFSSSEGKLTPFVMGCFGIGVSRLLPAVIESSHDSKGIIWPFSIAPYRVCIVPLIPKTNQPSDFTDVLNKLEQELNNIKGLKGEVILDDRYTLSIGSRLKDADLLGYPFVIVLGKSFAKEGKFELQVRANGEKLLLTMKELTKFLGNQVEFLSH
jgi:prolyl-tRNA synthetase